MTPHSGIVVVTLITVKQKFQGSSVSPNVHFVNRHNSKVIIIRIVILFQQPLNSCCATVLPVSVPSRWKERVTLLTKFQNNWKRSFKVQTLLWYRHFKGEWKLQRRHWECKDRRTEFLAVGISCKDTGSFFSHQKYVKTRNLIYSVLLDAICRCLSHDLMYKHENASLPLNCVSKYCLFISTPL